MSSNPDVINIQAAEVDHRVEQMSRIHEFANNTRRLIGRSLLILGLTSGSMISVEAVKDVTNNIEVASATEADGYPDSYKPCLSGDPKNPKSSYGKTTGTGYWCSGYSWGDIATGNQYSSRGFGYRNCTDWAAFRGQHLTGVLVPHGNRMGNAADWANNGRTAGYVVDNIPEPGDIAQWNATTSNKYGHVAVVESVNKDGTVNVSEYNGKGDGNYGTRSGLRANNYIDLNGTGTGINGQPISGGDSGIPHGSTTLGVYNPDNSVFYLRDSNDAGPAGVAFQYGNANWVPIAGDWDGNGTVTAGLYDPITSTFHLRNSHTSGPADRTFQYGNIGWKPIAGDWDGNGYWSVGLYNPADSTFYLKNFNGAGAADYTFSFGNSGWEPIAGDWDGRDDGNSASTIGVYNPTGSTFYLNNENDSSAADKTIQYGNSGWKPIAGDWDGNGFSSIGAYNPNSATFYLRNANSAGPADITVQYGNIGWKPVVGDWNAG